ncbi:MAG: sugar transferase [Patescibacteria group bacterium]
MNTAKKLALLGADILLLYGTLALTLLIRYGASSLFESWAVHVGPFSLLFILWLFVWYLADLYRPSAFRTRASLLSNLAIATAVAALLSTVALYLLSGIFELTPKTNLVIFSVLFLLLDFLARSMVSRKFATGALSVAVIGSSSLIPETAALLEKNPQIGYKITKIFATLSEQDLQDLKKQIREKRIDLVVTQPTFPEGSPTLISLYKLLMLEIEILNLWDFYEGIFEKIPLDELNETWFIENITTRRPFYDTAKRLVDMVASSILIIIFIPFMILTGILVLCSSAGSIIFSQERIGKGGKSFTLYKFRSMISDHNGSPWTEQRDARITPIGKILRYTHLDELPQLFNIFKGELSLTGPRPESAQLAEEFKAFPYYEIRHVIKPGLTGWAQIHYRPSASLEEAREKLRYDMYYIKNRSLFIDLLIVLKTVRYFFMSFGNSNSI